MIKPLFLKQPHPALRVANFLIAFECLIDQVRQGLTQVIKIRCANDSGGVRQVLGNRSGPIIEATADISGRLACLNIVDRLAKRTGQGNSSFLQLFGPSQERRPGLNIRSAGRRPRQRYGFLMIAHFCITAAAALRCAMEAVLSCNILEFGQTAGDLASKRIASRRDREKEHF